MSYLPSSTYVAPPRQARGRMLKTISEYEECSFGFKSDSEGDDSDRTIIARPAGLDAKLSAAAAARTGLSVQPYRELASPTASSPCSSNNSCIDENPSYQRESYASSDAGTVFSEESCPSLAGSHDTTIFTDSSRNSVSSDRSSRNRNRYPSIMIPRGSWQEENAIKEVVTLGMSPAQKLMLSPQALSSLPQHIPTSNAPPSFGDRSSIASTSPCVPALSSAPITPDMNNIVPVPGVNWGGVTHADVPLTAPLEIAIDEEHSILISPEEPRFRPERASSNGYSTDWSEMVVRFPQVPGLTPVDDTPIEPDLSALRGFSMQHSDHGVQLPNDAMSLLRDLTRSYSPDYSSGESGVSQARPEMKELSDAGARPKSAVVAETPISDYSFSQLSIPSPGGFFSSLQASSRATWCYPAQPKGPSMPSSAVAENFYDLPFRSATQSVETIIEVPDREVTDGPPTARQPGFEIPAEYRAESEEDDDLYGSSDAPREETTRTSPRVGYEYEATYERELTKAAEANIDRTSDWLCAQTTYLSALRESNPVNDPTEYIPQTPNPLNQTESETAEDSPAQKAVRFLEEAIRASNTEETTTKSVVSPKLKDSVFLEAFEHHASQRNTKDAFLQATARLETINTSRLALPVRHVHTLLNTFTTESLQAHSRPKYRGPFSQNPRQTGNFHRTPEQAQFAEAERQQTAMDHILPTVWTTEAQRKVLYKGDLLACPAAIERLAKQSKKQKRVLDLAGAATGSWAWAAAQKWSEIKIVTLITKEQSQLASQWSAPAQSVVTAVKPETLNNHKIVTVPELWKMPFKDNYFDVISARTLHMFLRARPVPEVPSIDEWDLTLKECMRVLKPGGVLDFVLLDSHITNNNSENKSKHSRDNSTESNGLASISPTAAYGQGLVTPPLTSTFGNAGSNLNPASLNFPKELKNRGFEADGGCSKITERLNKHGFVGIKRQWIGLPLGKIGAAHDNVAASYETFEAAEKAQVQVQAGLQRSKVGSVSHANGRSRTPFPPAPRPISEVSTISRILDQYANVEAVQGPVGSTADVADMAGLLGTMMWEEWLVRHRLSILNAKNRASGQSDSSDATFEAENLLYGINDVLAAGHAKGACFRGVLGWARKPGNKKPVPEMTEQQPQPIQIDTTRRESSYASRAAKLAVVDPAFQGFPSDETPITATMRTPQTANTMTPLAHQYYSRDSRQFITPVDRFRKELTLDTRRGMSVVSHGSPQWTESAVERGEVGTIPMMIVE